MPQLLLELLSEEIPARMQAGAQRDLERMARERLTGAELPLERMRSFAGPRRLVLVVDGLPAAQGDRVEERKGPRVGAPEAALAGFLRSAGVAQEALAERDGVWFATIARAGRPTREIIAQMVEEIVRTFPWPKAMTWASGQLRWVRPLQRILCVFDRDIVPLEIDGIVAGDFSEGHRFMGDGRPVPRPRLRRIPRGAGRAVRDAGCGRARGAHRDRRRRAVPRPATSSWSRTTACWAKWPGWPNGPCRCWATWIRRSSSCRPR